MHVHVSFDQVPEAQSKLRRTLAIYVPEPEKAYSKKLARFWHRLAQALASGVERKPHAAGCAVPTQQDPAHNCSFVACSEGELHWDAAECRDLRKRPVLDLGAGLRTRLDLLPGLLGMHGPRLLQLLRGPKNTAILGLRDFPKRGSWQELARWRRGRDFAVAV